MEYNREVCCAWSKAYPFRQSAVVAYYAIFSMPALLVIIITFAGFVFGQKAVQGEISNQISSVMGKETSLQIEGIIAYASEQRNSVWATVICIATLILGCKGVFGELQVSHGKMYGLEQ